MAIQTGGGFIQQPEAGGAEQGAGQRHALGLSHREAAGAIANGVFPSLGGEDLFCVGLTHRFLQLRILDMASHGEVIAQGAMYQFGILSQPTQLAAPMAHIQLAEFDACHGQTALIGQEAEQGIEQGTFARAGLANQQVLATVVQGKGEGANQGIALGA